MADSGVVCNFSASIEGTVNVFIQLFVNGFTANLGRRVAFFSFVMVYTVCRTPLTGDQLVAGPLPTQNSTDRRPCLVWDELTNPVFDRVENTVSNCICCWMRIRCRGNLFDEPLLRNGSGIAVRPLHSSGSTRYTMVSAHVSSAQWCHIGSVDIESRVVRLIIMCR
jgi:hypothetical protein